jgi:Fic family protein
MGKNYESRRKADASHWVEYFVRGFLEEIENIKNKVVALSRKKIDKKIESQIYLSREQLLILDFLDVTGRITANDVVDVLKCSKRSAQLHLQKLKKIKMIRQINKGPSSYYVLS